ncbi:hypothetical protein AVEN_159719-1 [Araneus ventricosus]|uniref:Uncharacterized protein n=1 Tax=Araneus ventricosus TaxID=182803 RepID=A0A4Y2JAA3_ARAVE|nr:hypothetical protein AVEN_159719-1 [Araneus ventricosus]
MFFSRNLTYPPNSSDVSFTWNESVDPGSTSERPDPIPTKKGNELPAERIRCATRNRIHDEPAESADSSLKRIQSLVGIGS